MMMPEAAMWGGAPSMLEQRGAHADERSAGAQTLVTLETIFCDYETNEDALTEYFRRFEVCLASIAAQRVPEDAEFLMTIHISSDKRDWIRRTQRLIDQHSLDEKARIRIHLYDHPVDGYGGDSEHVDWLKNPNKHSPYRERLFVSAHQDIDFSRYQRLIRVTIDDDDLWMPWHLETLVRLAAQALITPDLATEPVVALGPTESLIAYVEDDAVRLQALRMVRTLNGHKCMVITAPSNLEELAKLSPWSIPEVLTPEQERKAAARGVRLRSVHGHVPGFIYVRWGQNLSRQTKDPFVQTLYKEFTTDSVSALLALPRSQMPYADDPKPVFGLKDPELVVRATRTAEGSVRVTSNFDEVRTPGLVVSFYLLEGTKRVDARGYSVKGNAVFEDAPANVKVRGFLRLNGEIVKRVDSEIV